MIYGNFWNAIETIQCTNSRPKFALIMLQLNDVRPQTVLQLTIKFRIKILCWIAWAVSNGVMSQNLFCETIF